MISTDTQFYNDDGIKAELIAIGYRIIDGIADNYEDDTAICNGCNKILGKNHAEFVGHNLMDCLQEFNERMFNGRR